MNGRAGEGGDAVSGATRAETPGCRNSNIVPRTHPQCAPVGDDATGTPWGLCRLRERHSIQSGYPGATDPADGTYIMAGDVENHVFLQP